MILAMVSNVEDIANSLVDLEFWQAGGQCARARAIAPKSTLERQTVGCPYSEAGRRVQWRRPFSAISGVHRPMELDTGRLPTSGPLSPRRVCNRDVRKGRNPDSCASRPLCRPAKGRQRSVRSQKRMQPHSRPCGGGSHLDSRRAHILSGHRPLATRVYAS